MIFEANGVLRLLPASYYENLAHMEIQIDCHKYARYGLPTTELIDWFKNYIGDRNAIEIGAGSGDLCYHLGIIGVDNYQQTWPDVKLHYALSRQPTIKYGSWVERCDALDGVRKYKPDIVIGSWVTHWIDPDKPFPPGGGNMYGVKEDELLKLVDTYIVIGNLAVHAHKPIMKLPHEEHRFSFIKSRASYPHLDRMFIWKQHEITP